jgi:segregation and condensation protein A
MIKFTDLFGKATSRSEIVATFLALLELIRLGQVRVTQAQPFGEIEIHAVSARPASSAPAAGQSAAAQGALS